MKLKALKDVLVRTIKGKENIKAGWVFEAKDPEGLLRNYKELFIVAKDDEEKVEIKVTKVNKK